MAWLYALLLILLHSFIRVVFKKNFPDFYFSDVGYTFVQAISIFVVVKLGNSLFSLGKEEKAFTWEISNDSFIRIIFFLIGSDLAFLVVNCFMAFISPGRPFFGLEPLVAVNADTHILYSLVGAPILEEWFFRGTLLRRFLMNYSRVHSYLAVSFFFLLMHVGKSDVGPDGFDLISKLSIFFLSLLLCWVRHSTGSLVVVMILHAASNAFLLTFPFLLSFIGLNVRQLPQFAFAMIAMVIMSCILIWRSDIFKGQIRNWSALLGTNNRDGL